LREADSALVRACQAGDRRAWETLIRRYQRLLYAIPIRCGLSEDDAADVFQTVCVRLLENLHKLRDEEHLTGWLITTARRESWRVQRVRRRDTPLGSDDPEDAGESPLDNLTATDLLPQEEAMRLEEEQLVRGAMEELSERCRTLLGWLYHTDPPPQYAEIARRLNVPVGAIGPTRARCLQQLKRILQRHGF
jgi:RNA polymerase sigma factor (sigma-70 family)